MLNAGAVATFDAKRCQLSSVASLSHWASTLQHVRRDGARRAGLSATADPCSYSCAAADKSSVDIVRRAVPLRKQSFLFALWW